MPFKSGIGTCLWVKGDTVLLLFFPEECIIASSRWGGKAFSNETIAVFSSKGSIIISSKEGKCKRFQGL